MQFIQSLTGIVLTAVLFAAAPTSSTYKLESYGMGSGGTANSSSSTYSATGIAGEASQTGSSATYTAGTGLVPTQQANVPAAPTLTNPSSYYNKLHIVIDTGGNPSDATFAIAISPDGFASTTNYVQSDQTVGASLGAEDWLTYSAWGSGTGVDIIGLQPSTTYTVKVKAEHGNFTESAYSATSSAATVGASLTFDIDVSSSDTETGSPYTISLGSLVADSVVDSPEYIWIDLETNGDSGAMVFVASANGGLNSPTKAYTITSASANLAAVNEGFGAQNSSATQSAGGPLTAQAPYTGASQNVGITDSNLRQLYVSSTPITAGRGSLLLKARSTVDTPAGNDYTDTLTLVAAAVF
ncbi:MAG: hypothetical protein KIH63_004005 [Candidatus Saccharibacteria bacterium]|nr:hypothetical protein [Candidatus Saccharibacteria bacterium]